MRIITLLMLILIVAVSECTYAQVQPYKISRSPGLNVVDAEDGKWDIIPVPDATVAGKTAVKSRPNTTPPSNYMYFQFTPEMRQTLGSDVYLVVDFLDDGYGMVGFEYNSQQSPYTVGNGFIQTSTGKWRKALLHTTDAQFKGLQNSDADFRFFGQLTIAGIEVYKQKPDIVIVNAGLKMHQIYRFEFASPALVFYSGVTPSKGLFLNL